MYASSATRRVTRCSGTALVFYQLCYQLFLFAYLLQLKLLLMELKRRRRQQGHALGQAASSSSSSHSKIQWSAQGGCGSRTTSPAGRNGAPPNTGGHSSSRRRSSGWLGQGWCRPFRGCGPAGGSFSCDGSAEAPFALLKFLVEESSLVPSSVNTER